MEKCEVEIGKFYHFWDDAKSSISRHYLCKCEGIITLEESEELLYNSYYWSHDDGETVALTLKEIWERNGATMRVFNLSAPFARKERNRSRHGDSVI
mgnify:CR=1 FL=1